MVLTTTYVVKDLINTVNIANPIHNNTKLVADSLLIIFFFIYINIW
jgi:hypothetical protein